MVSLPPKSPTPAELVGYDVPVSLSREVDRRTLSTNGPSWSSWYGRGMAQVGRSPDDLPVEVVALQARAANLRRLESRAEAACRRLEREVEAERQRNALLSQSLAAARAQLRRSEAKRLVQQRRVLSQRAHIDELRRQRRAANERVRSVRKLGREKLKVQRNKIDRLRAELFATGRWDADRDTDPAWDQNNRR